ncbi:MAG: gliding motility lipoprotein GldJ [Bacteroidia bacterium]|nr:MAG: gliding motility lipoprotein GldJ [Bacteroidia bacterium]
MKARRILLALVMASFVVFSLGSCKNRGGKVSQTTGWKYNDKEFGGFMVVEGYHQETAPGLVFIEGGTFIMGRTQEDVMHDWNAAPRRVTVSSYYIDETETSNVAYREYLFWLRRVLVSFRQVYVDALPDTLVWRSPLGYNEPFVENYLRHPAYSNYPVVGVSWRQVTDFAQWRSNRVNELMLHKKGILKMDVEGQHDKENFDTDAYLLGQYNLGEHQGLPNNLPGADGEQSRHVTLEDGIMYPKYRLPTEAEWEFAAYGLLGNTVEETVGERKVYPWNGHNVRNSNSKNIGQFMANFVRGKGDFMGTAGDLNDRGDITLPVNSFWPNDYGLYCMAGNVNEWVMDVYRPLSFEEVDEFRPFRGNIFQTYVMDENSDPNGGPVVAGKDSLGRIRRRNITDEEAAGRPNYDRAYNINYKDGDIESTIQYRDPGSVTEEQSTTNMYYQGIDKGNEKGVGMVTLINDRSRVYKGGGWKDRAYWLSPGARRFLDENQSASDIGFRLAMDGVGAQAEEDRK